MSSPDEKPDGDPAGSGSIDVELAGRSAVLPVATTSGSIDVQLSSTKLAAVDAGVPVAVPTGATDESAPIGRRSRSRMQTASNAVGDTVGKVGDGVSKLGEGVTRLGDATHKVPLLGAGISMIGESMQAVGESMHELPRMTKTRRGRLLVRSMIVGFLLVTAWILVIVGLQIRGNDTHDFRPAAATIFAELSKGPSGIELVYDQASPRFQEITRKERFVDDMVDQRATVGQFREVTAVNDTLITTGPSGRVGRVSLTIAFEKATCKASVSFHYDGESWKFLGIGVELPPELTISQQQREERIAACKDPMNPKTCDVHAATVHIFEQLQDGHVAEVWDQASPVFQKQEERARFVEIQNDHLERLGRFRRIIAVSEAKVIGGTSATFDVLIEYEKSSGVRAVIGFYRSERAAAWKLRNFKVVVPFPRATEKAGSAAASEPVKPAVVKPPVTPGKPTKPAIGSGTR